MLNRERIVKTFNAKNGKRISANNSDVIVGIMELEERGLSEDDIIMAIERGYIESKADLLNASRVAEVIEHMKSLYAEPTGVPIFNTKPIEEVIDVEPIEEPIEEPVKEPVTNGQGILEQAIFGVVNDAVVGMVEPKLDALFDQYVKENPSRVQTTIEWVNPDTGKHTEGVQHHEFETIAQIVGSGENALLVGPAGTGKNFLCKQLADFFGLDFYFANAVTQEHKLIGFIDANGTYHETQFYKAYTNGGLFMFDELDASDESVLVTFNAALENGYMDFPTGRVYAHEDFKCVACANTFGNGASMEYVGRTELDMATLDRFVPVRIDYDAEIEKSMTDDLSLIEFIHTFRQACEEYGIHHVTSYRGLRRCAKFKDVFGIKKTLETAIVRNLEHDDLMMMVDKFENKVDEWSTTFCEIARGC